MNAVFINYFLDKFATLGVAMSQPVQPIIQHSGNGEACHVLVIVQSVSPFIFGLL